MKPIILFLSLLTFFSFCIERTQAQYLPLQADLDTLSNSSQFDLSDEPKYSVQFSEPVVFNDSDLIMGDISSVAVDSNGDVYIADSDQLTIHRFTSDGSFIESFGRDGDGPGEFRSLLRIRYREGKVYALDRSQNRITAFRPDSLDAFHSISLSVNPQSSGSHLRSMPEEFFVLPENKFLLAFSLVAGDSERLYFQPVDILQPDRGYLNTDDIRIPVDQSVLFSNSGNMGFINPIYGRRSTLYATSDGTIYSNWSEHMLFKLYDSGGNYTGALYDRINKKPLTRRQLRERYSDFYMDILRNEELPDRWPALRSFLVDDDKRLWIELFTEDFQVSEWIIVSKEEGLLGKFSLSSEDSIHLVQDDFIYVTDVDTDGLESVKKFRVLLN